MCWLALHQKKSQVWHQLGLKARSDPTCIRVWGWGRRCGTLRVYVCIRVHMYGWMNLSMQVYIRVIVSDSVWLCCTYKLFIHTFILWVNIVPLKLRFPICGTHRKVYSFDQIRSGEYLGQVFRLWLKWELAPDWGMGSGGGGKWAAKLKHSFGTGKEGEQMVAPHLSCEGLL